MSLGTLRAARPPVPPCHKQIFLYSPVLPLTLPHASHPTSRCPRLPMADSHYTFHLRTTSKQKYFFTYNEKEVVSISRYDHRHSFARF